MNFKTLYKLLERSRWKNSIDPSSNDTVNLLKPYANDPTIYLHFSEFNKLGINPLSSYDTPAGIYLYPLNIYWKKYVEKKSEKFTKVIPFKSEARYIIIGKLKSDINFKDFSNDIQYEEYNSYIKKLKTYYNIDERLFDMALKKIIDYTIEKKRELSTSYLGKIWYITKEISNKNNFMIILKEMSAKTGIAVNYNNLYEKYTSDNNIVQWAMILYKILGISGFMDSAGVGIIHTNEPVQAVVFHSRFIDHIDTIENKEQFSSKNEQLNNKKLLELRKLFGINNTLSPGTIIDLNNEKANKKDVYNILLDSVNYPGFKYKLPSDCSSLFYGCALDIRNLGANWDTSEVVNMSKMFGQCMFLNPNTSKWNTSKVTNMSLMFYRNHNSDCDLTHWDVSAVTNMERMFDLSSRANPNTTKWITSNVKNMMGMFMNSKLANPDVKNWDLKNVINISDMFSESKSANPDIKNWDIPKCIDNFYSMRNLFEGAKAAEKAKIDIENWMSFKKIAIRFKNIDELKKYVGLT